MTEELNQIKPKDLRKIFNEEQTKQFLQFKRSLGGKFHSLQQLQKKGFTPLF